jgi:hypothetical protein
MLGELLAIVTSAGEVTRLVARPAVAMVDEVVGECRLDKIEVEVAVAHLERDVPDEFETVQVRLLGPLPGCGEPTLSDRSSKQGARK